MRTLVNEKTLIGGTFTSPASVPHFNETRYKKINSTLTLLTFFGLRYIETLTLGNLNGVQQFNDSLSKFLRTKLRR